MAKSCELPLMWKKTQKTENKTNLQFTNVNFCKKKIILQKIKYFAKKVAFVKSNWFDKKAEICEKYM